MLPLYKALKGKMGSEGVDWSLEWARAFEDSKAALVDAALLAHQSPAAPIALTTDVLFPVGAVSEQWLAGAW